jgi:hypothetical protein
MRVLAATVGVALVVVALISALLFVASNSGLTFRFNIASNTSPFMSGTCVGHVVCACAQIRLLWYCWQGIHIQARVDIMLTLHHRITMCCDTIRYDMAWHGMACSWVLSFE